MYNITHINDPVINAERQHRDMTYLSIKLFYSNKLKLYYFVKQNFAESFDSKESKMKRNRIKICKIEVWKEDNLIIAHVMTI